MQAVRAPFISTACTNPCLRGAVLLAGWLWLGWQGERLGWSLAAGLGVVALWWALRLLLGRWAPPGRRAWSWAMGMGTGLGVLLVEQVPLGGAGLPVLMATAVSWALWSATWALPTPTAIHPGTHPPRHTLTTLAAQTLPASAMGLMMGSLWLSGQWCATTGWPASSMVLLHVAFMVLLPTLLRGSAHALQSRPVWRDTLPLALLVLGGACVLFGTTPVSWMLGMALQAVAWALQQREQTIAAPSDVALTPQSPATNRSRASVMTRVLPMCGPLLLVLVGLLSPTWGPAALHSAQALLGALALAALLPPVWRWLHRPPSLTLAPSTYPDTP